MRVDVWGVQEGVTLLLRFGDSRDFDCDEARLHRYWNANHPLSLSQTSESPVA